MPKQKSSTYLEVAKLSSLREKIVFYLSENPNLNAQAIQKALEYPSNQYPNILKALKTLEKSELIKSKSGKSKKKIPIRLYRCTDKGILYALARNSKADALRTINAYENIEELAKSFRASYDILGPELFFKFVRDADEFLLMVQKDDMDNVAPYMVMKMARQTRHLDSETRTRIVKELGEQFPQAMRILKEWFDSVSQLF
jgi:DNA-binding PadR family transcriptional regulator